jgi:hypothetical protein
MLQWRALKVCKKEVGKEGSAKGGWTAERIMDGKEGIEPGSQFDDAGSVHHRYMHFE